ncbi:hypothetical protein M0R45_000372 [Rubus argutus]|uniref:Reverse transcriptase domain-containing protein n=1 Tax=Rubus argutus TaxID=59490 RepID=A0AAW1VNK9_RUBAR
MLSLEEGCGIVIGETWSNAGRMPFMEKLKLVAGNLKAWKRGRFGSVRHSISELRNELDILQRQTVSSLISQRREEQTNLGVPFTRVEIEAALKGMGPTKAPGQDGMSPIFYQKYWSVGGPNVVPECLRVLNGQCRVKELNHTLIVLILEVPDPKKVTEFRPISLCNVVYKLVSKVLANRLKLVLSDVISEYQSAFVPNRLIFDHVIAAFETVHCLKRRGRKSRQKIAVKLDMAQAYDRVEWGFLQRMMTVLGFPQRFMNLIMDCVSTVSYSILIHGSPFGKITPTRGIRQGDPLSPLSPSLFLLVAEGFSALLRKAEKDKVIHGVSIARGAPSISHLFFADDSLIFCDASVHDCTKLREIFACYEMASGQKINTDKSAMSFSPRTSARVKEACCCALNIGVVPCHEKYLGLPTVTGRDKKAQFKGLADRVWNRVQGWEGKILSRAGKETLIKVVVQAIPTYTMSVFQLPVGICDEINRSLARFWWGKTGEKEFKISPKAGVDTSIMVADLIIEHGEWEEASLAGIGTVQEVEAILHVPLIRSSLCDHLIWNFNRHGKYTVKSGYWLALKERDEGSGVGNCDPVVIEYWRHLWKLKVPPKMLHFFMAMF